MWIYISTYIITILIIIASLISILLIEKNKYLEEQINNNKKLIEDYDKYAIYLKENMELKKLEDKEALKVKTFNGNVEKIENKKIYKDKKALIGDYFPSSYRNTETVLRNLGFIVDTVPTIKEVVEKVKYEKRYDVIFSNNFYHDGSGQECLERLKALKNFNTPIVIHTIDKEKREFFVNEIGFDDYIVKPVTLKNVTPVLERLFKE